MDKKSIKTTKRAYHHSEAWLAKHAAKLAAKKEAAPVEKKVKRHRKQAAKKIDVKKDVKKPAKKAPACDAPKLSVQPRGDGKPVSDPALCVYCGICAKKCPGGALEVDRAAKTWKLDEEKCLACGACADACPKKCIAI